MGILLAHVPYPVTLSQVSCSLFKRPIYSATGAYCPSLFPSSSLPTGQMLLFNSKQTLSALARAHAAQLPWDTGTAFASVCGEQDGKATPKAESKSGDK